jgi:hypothetical protein
MVLLLEWGQLTSFECPCSVSAFQTRDIYRMVLKFYYGDEVVPVLN